MQRGRRRITVAAPSVVAPDAPTLTAPADEADVYDGVAVTVSATVTAGQVPDRIDFVLDPGVSEVVVATDSASPYSQSWTPTGVTPGAHTLVARFVYGSGSVDSAAADIVLFNPDVLANCVLWLDGRMGITKDGSNLVSQWDDQSGNANHFLQGTGANQPLWVDNAYGAVDVVRGQDVNDNLQHASTVSLGTAGTLFFVAKQGSAASNYMIADNGPTNGVISRFTGALVEWFNGSGADRHTLANGPSGLHVYTIRQTNGVALQGWLDGVSAFGPVVPNAALIALKSLLALKTPSNGSAAQDFAGVVAYDAALNDTNRARVEAYLAARNEI